MTSREFLSILEESLQGELPAAEITSNLNYYRDYIQSQQTGKSEEEAVDGLGDPRLIARTIISTYQMNHGAQHYDSAEQGASYTYTQNRQADSTQDGDDRYQSRKQPKVHTYSMPGWLGSILGLLIMILIIVAVFWIGGIVLKLFFRFVLPVLLIVAGVAWVRNMLRR